MGDNAVYLSFDAINFLSISCPAVPVQSKLNVQCLSTQQFEVGINVTVSEIEKSSNLLALLNSDLSRTHFSPISVCIDQALFSNFI